MLTLPSTVQIFISVDPVDLRKGFNGLSAIVREVMRKDPLSGHLFCFINRRRDRAKILLFDRGGYWIFYRRLERGTFKPPQPADELYVQMEAPELSLLLEGIDLAGAKRRPRWRPPVRASQFALQ
ncbi:MAG: IS66 family insertion sequence element accessory protein TnpB [Planctomycetota bacterium]|nr:IS66 family insertion sequence element accessory protein TnpB [Planctomycetota bacterium]